MPAEGPSNDSEIGSHLRKEIVEGLLYAHSRLSTTTGKTLEVASFLYALVELLSEKGLITIEELDERKAVVAGRMVEQWREKGVGVVFQDPEYDKYAFEHEVEIDCAGRVHLCRAACCRLPFALSKQDLREGVVRWDLGQPYLICQGKDGYCNHLDRATKSCTIHRQRPAPCRGFDCRKDTRIWRDFEKRIPNPDLERPDWPMGLTPEGSQDETP